MAIRKPDAAGRQLVQMRSRIAFAAVAAQAFVSHIVCHQQDDVRLAVGSDGGLNKRADTQYECGEKQRSVSHCVTLVKVGTEVLVRAFSFECVNELPLPLVDQLQTHPIR